MKKVENKKNSEIENSTSELNFSTSEVEKTTSEFFLPPSLRISKNRHQGFGTTLAIDGGGDDAAGITRPFTTREQTGQTDVLQGVALPHDAHRCAFRWLSSRPHR